MPTASDHSVALPLAVLLAVVPIVYIGSFGVFSYATADLRDGAWALLIVDFLGESDDAIRGLLGARSRLVWSALTVLFALAMVFTTVFSLLILARGLTVLRPWFLAGVVLAAILFAVGMWNLGPSQIAGCITDPCGHRCATQSTGRPFLIIPYMGGLLCKIYEPLFVSYF